MRKKIMKWLPGLLCVALVVGNLTYVSANASDQEGTSGLTASVSGSDFLQTDFWGNEVDAPENDADISGTGESVSGNDTSSADADTINNDGDTSEADVDVSGADVDIFIEDAGISSDDANVFDTDITVSGNDASVSEIDADESLMLLDSDAPWALDSVEISFNRQYQALVVNAYSQYYCVDFDECPEAESDIKFGSRYAKADEMDIYVYSTPTGSWIRCSFNGWGLLDLNYTIQETSYTEEEYTISQYDPRAYVYGGRTYRLSEADAKISATMTQDSAVWGDDNYHGVRAGCYWFADEGLLIVSGEMLSRPQVNIATPAYKADCILYTNYYAQQADITDNVRTVCIDKNITEIGNWAFAYCSSLEKVVIDGTVESIGESAFFGCSSLQEIELKEGLEHIGNSAFFGCASLDVDQIPNTVSSIGSRAFHGTGVTNIRIPDGVTTIEESTFYGCQQLKTLDLNRVAVIKNDAFGNCAQLTLTQFPDSVIEVGDQAFFLCPYVVIEELPERLTDEKIGEAAFQIPYTVIRYLIDFDYRTSDGYIPDNPDKVLESSEYKRYYDPDWTVEDALSDKRLQIRYGYVEDGKVRYTYSLSYPDCAALSEEEIYGKFIGEYGNRITSPSPENFVCLGYVPYQKYGSDGTYHEYTFLGIDNRVVEAYGSHLTDKVEPSQNIYLYYRDAAFVTELSRITAEYTGGEVVENGRISKEDITVKATYITTYESGAKRTSYRTVSADDFEIAPETAALGENQVTVSLSERPDVSFTFPDLIYICYEVGAVPDYLWASVRSYYTDSGRNYLDDGQHGEEMGESLTEVTKTADVVVIGVNRAETGRHQTGIEASYPRLSQMEGSDIVLEDVTVYPIYTIEYNDGTQEENVKGDTPLSPEDYEVDKETLEKEGNTVTVTSGEFEDSFEVFGNYKDGIIAEYPRSEEMEGTVLDKDDFTVYYTYTMMDPDTGEMSYHVPDRDSAVGSFDLNEDVIHLGSNTITVTETDDDAAWTDSVDITGTARQTEPDPDPEPEPDPDPEPTPDPNPDPEPTPDPDPTPSPDPDPSPEPTPDSGQEPTPEPTPDPGQEPTPEPTPDPGQEPTPEPTPDPQPESTPGQEETPDPTPEPETTSDPTPEQTPEPGPESTPEPEDIPCSGADPEVSPTPGTELTSTPEPGEGESLIPTWEPALSKAKHCPKLEIAFLAGILAALLLTLLGGFFLFLILWRRRKRFCGILTEEDLDGVKIKPYRDTYELAQDVIDRSASLEECITQLQKSGDFTYLPKDTSMTISFNDHDGMSVRMDREANEKVMYEILEGLEGRGRVEVTLYDGDNFEIILIFHL